MSRRTVKHGQNVFRVLWGTYIRNALIPIVFIELALIAAYLITNYIIRDENIATMQRSAQESLLETASLESDVITSQLNGVIEMVDLFAALVGQAYDKPHDASEQERSRYTHSDNGVWHTRTKTPGAAMFYSSITSVGENEKRKAWQLVQIDPLMKQLVESSSLVTQAYLNTHDSMNRIYPPFDVLDQYPFDLNVTDYNFYYEADAEHNAQRQVVWTDVYIDPAGQGWMASAIAPVYRNNTDFLEGVVGLDIQVSEIIRQVLALSLPWDGYALLVDSSGTIMAMPEAAEKDWQLQELTEHDYATAIKQDTFKPEAFNLFKREDSIQLAQGMTSADIGVVELELADEPKLAAWSLIPGADWHLVVVADQARLYSDANALKARVDQIAIGMILSLLAFYLLFMVYLYRKSIQVSLKLSQPMGGLRRMIRAIGEGRYQPQPVATDITELAEVSNGLIEMGHTLAQNRAELDEANRRLASLNQALEARVRERTHKLQQVNADLHREQEEQNRLIEELKETQAQLIQSEKMASVGLLATGVAHEINNPLAFVSANVSMLHDYAPTLMRLCKKAEEQPPELWGDHSDGVEQQKLYAAIGDVIVDLLEDSVEGVRRIRHITESLLEFSHSGDTSWQDCDVNHCIETTLAICGHEYKYKARVETVLVPDLPLIRAVPAQLNQVIMALVVNAAQAITNEGVIRVRTCHEGESVSFSVCDTGCGIEPANLNRVFEPFFTTKEVGKGTGLGLAVAYGIIKAHNGKIEVESTLGEGSCFRVVLPLQGGHSQG